MGNVTGAALAIIGGIIGLAVVAVIVSKQANTSGVLTSAGSALSSIINAAVGPVSGSSNNLFGAGR